MARPPDLAALSLFDVVARLGNLTRAASELGLTQPSVSYQIRQLEEGLGCSLFERRHRGVDLTEEGRILRDAVQRALGTVEDALATLRRRRAAPTVGLVTDFAFASYILLPRLGRLKERHPDIDVRVSASQVEVEPAGRGIDLSVSFGQLPVGGRGVRLLQERVIALCSPGFLAAHGPLDDPAALARAPLIHLDGPERWFSWPSWMQAVGWPWRPGVEGLHVNTFTLAIEAAMAGQGVVLGWLGLVDGLMDAGLLVPATGRVAVSEAGYILRLARTAPPAALAVADWLKEELAPFG
ncbi:LysR substrate-binding domain-containing protein [Radicibacter daui]|uniref:LysR substrate-binding domain-containing protein n=1 Tax=Radicibacter daui TaxID=3064829 RepID=UPI004046C8BB